MEITKHKRSDLADKGKWFDIGDGAKIQLRGLSCRKFQEMYDELMEPHKTLKRRGLLDKDKEVAIVRKALAGAVIVDWKGIEEKGNAVPFSPGNAERLLATYENFADIVADIARGSENFVEEQDLEGIENAKKS